MSSNRVTRRTLKGECWRRVPGYEAYTISNLGRLCRDKKLVKPNLHNRGYLKVRLFRNGHGHGWLMHRIVLLAFKGPAPRGYEACHYNGKRTDNRLRNLRWDTRGNNQRDKIRHGTANFGKGGGFRCTS